MFWIAFSPPLHGSHWLGEHNFMFTGNTWFPYEWGQVFWSSPWPELVYRRAEWRVMQGDLMTYDVWIEVHLCSRCVRSRSAIVIFHWFQSVYRRLIHCAFKERYLALGKFHLLVNEANGVAMSINNLHANEYFRTQINSNQKDSFVNSTSKSYA